MIGHAQIDHIGRVPLLVKRGFAGPIFIQQADGEPMPVMLLDSVSLAESDAERANRKLRPGDAEVVPLYVREDVEQAMRQLQPMPYGTCREILPGVEIALTGPRPERPVRQCG